jgi:ornithine cyclodeaminase
MRFPILDDGDVERLADMGAFVRTIEAFLRAKSAGSVVAPPRHSVSFGALGRLVFTIGGSLGPQNLAGFRVYDTFAAPGGSEDQIVAVWNAETGKCLGLILGDALGAWRTGAIGGTAARCLTPDIVLDCAVLGTGRQARTQLLGLAAVRSLGRIRVYGRDDARRAAFCRKLSEALAHEVEPMPSAEAAIRGADAVLCATSSGLPILELEWLKPGAYVATVGMKLRGAHELPVEIGWRTRRAVTDSMGQIRSYPLPYFLDGTPAWEHMGDLADLVAEPREPAEGDGFDLFCSAGLAGTEVALAAQLLAAADPTRYA